MNANGFDYGGPVKRWNMNAAGMQLLRDKGTEGFAAKFLHINTYTRCTATTATLLHTAGLFWFILPSVVC